MPKLSALPALCGVTALVLVTGCSSNSITSPSALSGANATEFSALGGSTRVGLNHYNDPGAIGTGGNPSIACNTNAPRVFHGGVLGMRMELQWQPVFNVVRYQVQVEKQRNNIFEPFLMQTITDGVYTEWNGFEGERFRARVRSVVCGTEGAWSDFIYLSTDGEQEHKDIEPGGDPEPPGGGGGGGGTTTTFWFTDKGNDSSRESGCENPGQGQVGTYLGDGVCQLETPSGGTVEAPQPFWEQIPEP